MTHIIHLSRLTQKHVTKVSMKYIRLAQLMSVSGAFKIPDSFLLTATAYHAFTAQENVQKAFHLFKNKRTDSHSFKHLIAHSKDLLSDIQLDTALTKDITEAFNALNAQQDCQHYIIRPSFIKPLETKNIPKPKNFIVLTDVNAVLEHIKQVFLTNLLNEIDLQTTLDICLCIQPFIHSQIAGSISNIDPQSEFNAVAVIQSSYGLGSLIHSKQVQPDTFYIYKNILKDDFPILRRHLGTKIKQQILIDNEPSTQTISVNDQKRGVFSLNDTNINQLMCLSNQIETTFKRAFSIEWASNINCSLPFILNIKDIPLKKQNQSTLTRYLLKERSSSLLEGRSIGKRIASGTVRIVNTLKEAKKLQPGDILVTDITDPNWEPYIKNTSAILTNKGGRTCHAAIIARELEIPAVVGCETATLQLKNKQQITVSCAEGDTGFVYDGKLKFDITKDIERAMSSSPINFMLNIGNPDKAFELQKLPNQGVGLVRLEFIISRMIGIHPNALLQFNELPKATQDTINRRVSGYQNPSHFYIEKLAESLATLAAAFYPKKVMVRLSDFKSNEYAHLIGGESFEPKEENPMLGFRGASRYISKKFRSCFDLECQALKKVRNNMGFTNIDLIIPFVRTPIEGKQVCQLLAENGLHRGDQGLRFIMMCELPTNALLANEFLVHFDGFSIGSNDLTQLTLGVDRNSSQIAHLFDEENDAVKNLIFKAIKACKSQGKYVSLCGQAPSDYPDFSKWLMEQDIDSISLNPDALLTTWSYLEGTA